MTTRQRNLAVLLVLGVLAAAGAYLAGPPERRARAIDAAPESAFLVVTLDLGRLRASSILSELGFVRQSGLDDITSQCGFDPIDRAREALVAVPESGDAGDFGLAIVTDLSREDLVACASKVLAARGGSAAVHEEGGYTIVEDPSLGGLRPRIATKPGAPVFIGHGDWLHEMMLAYDGKAPRADVAGKPHARLREKVSAGEAAIAATAILPKSLRDKLKDEIQGGRKPAGPTFQAVLAVGEVAVALRVAGDAGGREGLSAVAECESGEACDALRAFLEKKREALAKDLGVRLIGLGALLDHAKLEVRGTDLVLTLDASAAEIARVASRASLAQAMPEAPPPVVPNDAGARRPDEIIPARDR